MARFMVVWLSLVLLSPTVAGQVDRGVPDVTAAEAARIEAGLNAGVANASNWLMLESPLRVTVEDSGYRIAIPPATISADAFAITLGDWAVDLVPRAGARYRVVWTVPERIIINDVADDSGDQVSILIGEQRGTAVWSSTYETLLGLDIAWSDITFVLPPDDAADVSLAIESLAVSVASDEVSPGVVDLRYQATVSGFALDARDVGFRAGVGAISVSAALDTFRFGTFADFADELLALAQQHEVDRGPSPVDPALLAEMAAVAESTDVLGAFRVDVALKDLEGAFLGSSVGIGRMHSSVSTTDLDQSAMQLSFQHSLHEAVMMPDIGFGALMPSAVRTGLILDGLPIALFPSFVLSVVSTDDGATPLDTDMLIETAVRDGLTATRPLTAIGEVYFRAPAGVIDLRTEARGDPSAIDGAVWNADIEIRRLEDLLAALRFLPVDLDDTAFVDWARTFGELSVDPDSGDPILSYDISLEADGRLLVNGNDLTPIIAR